MARELDEFLGAEPAEAAGFAALFPKKGVSTSSHRARGGV